MKAGDLIVEKGGRTFVDVAAVLPDWLEGGRRVEKIETGESLKVRVIKRAGRGGSNSKGFILSRFLELDEFFFENLGLWEGEGGKHKGLYFGNISIEALLHFIKFSEDRIGVSRMQFNVTLNVPKIRGSEEETKREWSEKLSIPYENFTNICIDERINEEYAQLYVNGIIMSELMNNLHSKLMPCILERQEFAAAYLRGFIAAEAAVVLKEWGTVAHVSVANRNMDVISFVTECLALLGISRGKYFESSGSFPIHGKLNFDIVRKYELMRLNIKKNQKFEDGMNKFQRTVFPGDKMESMILELLKSGPKTYDDIAIPLNKGRSTIQSHYVPILERKGMIRKSGKKGRAWLFEAV